MIIRIERPIVRLADISDIETIIQIAYSTWWKTYPGIISNEQISYMLEKMYSAPELEDGIKSERQLFYVAEYPSDKLMIGFAGYGVAQQPNVYRLHKLYILPDIHKSGAGSMLLNAVEKVALASGASAIELNVNIANPAIGFYKRKGFYEKERMDLQFGPFVMVDYIMRKELSLPAY